MSSLPAPTRRVNPRINLPIWHIIFRIAWRNVRRNFRHSIAALGTMAVGFVALALFQGYVGELMRSQLDLIHRRAMVGDVMVRKPGGGTREARIDSAKYWLDEDDQRFLDAWIAAHPSEITTRMRALQLMGVAHAGGTAAQIMAWGHDVAEGRAARRDWAWNALAGHPLRDDEPAGALLGKGLGAILGCVPTSNQPFMDPVTFTPIPVERPMHCSLTSITLSVNSARHRMNALDAEVVGLSIGGAREYEARVLWIPLPFAQELASTRSVSLYMINLRQPADAPRLRAELSAAARRAGRALDVVDWMETEDAEIVRRSESILSVCRGLAVLVILIIAGAAVLTTMMKTVRERTREIGTLRSLGYRRHHLLAMFAAESALLAMCAGLVGLLSAVAITAAINSSRIMYKAGLMAEAIPLRIGYSPVAYALGFLFLSLVAVVAALTAARKVTSMRIAEALTDGC